jgi:hypothetical protein
MLIRNKPNTFSCIGSAHLEPMMLTPNPQPQQYTSTVDYEGIQSIKDRLIKSREQQRKRKLNKTEIGGVQHSLEEVRILDNMSTLDSGE